MEKTVPDMHIENAIGSAIDDLVAEYLSNFDDPPDEVHQQLDIFIKSIIHASEECSFQTLWLELPDDVVEYCQRQKVSPVIGSANPSHILIDVVLPQVKKLWKPNPSVKEYCQIAAEMEECLSTIVSCISESPEFANADDWIGFFNQVVSHNGQYFPTEGQELYYTQAVVEIMEKICIHSNGYSPDDYPSQSDAGEDDSDEDEDEGKESLARRMQHNADLAQIRRTRPIGWSKSKRSYAGSVSGGPKKRRKRGPKRVIDGPSVDPFYLTVPGT